MRSGTRAAELLQRIRDLAAACARPLTLMEVCGTHTMAIARAGLRALLPSQLRLISGPGCPVCVTEQRYVDHAIALCAAPRCTIASFGDMLRVPGTRRDDAPRDLLHARAAGADVRVVYSPRDALSIAHTEPQREVVFLGVGFETTTPAVAATILEAQREGLRNFSVLTAHKTIPGAMLALARADAPALDGFLCPGHVSVVIGPEPYAPLAESCGVACAIAGFEPLEILRGLAALLEQLAAGRASVANCYGGAVRPGGNPRARAVLEQAFAPTDAVWRGLGRIPGSGLTLRPELRALDAAERFELPLVDSRDPPGCRCGDVLRGAIDPPDCPLFGRTCTPEDPVGACMVSSEGSCAASFTHGDGAPR